MITKMTGRITRLHNDAVHLSVDAWEYEVLIPEFVRQQLQSRIGETISLHTIQYLEGNPTQGKLTPRLVGFLKEAEREFFELFCSVNGVGSRRALRAMVQPVAEIASAIEEQNVKALSSLPGIGAATAEKVIASLRRKVPKFALLIADRVAAQPPETRGLIEETFDVLRSLGHGEAEARRLLDEAVKSGRKFKDVQDLLQAVYESSHSRKR